MLKALALLIAAFVPFAWYMAPYFKEWFGPFKM